MGDTADVVVVGAGIIGCATAYYLSREGAKVRMLDMDAIGSGASAHATGFLSLLGTEFPQGPPWRFGLEGYRMFVETVPQLEEQTGMDLLWQEPPGLRLALEEEEIDMIKEGMAWQAKDTPIEWIGAEDVRKIEPRLTPNVLGAAYQPKLAQLDSYRLTLALGRAAELNGTESMQRRVMGLVREGSRVTGVKLERDEVHCDTVVLAMGAWSSESSSWLDFPVPVTYLKGERLMLRYDGPRLPVLISSPKRGHMISRMDGFLSVGSTRGRDYDKDHLFLGMEFDRQPSEKARMDIMGWATDVFPDLENAELVEQLAGSRPLSPDRLPIIGPVPGTDGVMLAPGHTTKGIHLSLVTGKALADRIFRGSTDLPVDMTAFLPDRFTNAPTPDFQASGQDVEE